MSKFFHSLFLAGMLVSAGCSSSDSDEETYPLNVSYNTCELMNERGCRITPDSVYIINSTEKLAQLLLSAKRNSPIDFKKHSLLAIMVDGCNADSQIEQLALQKTGSEKYSLSVNVSPSSTANGAPLIIGMLTPKIKDEAFMEIKIDRHRYKLLGD